MTPVAVVMRATAAAATARARARDGVTVSGAASRASLGTPRGTTAATTGVMAAAVMVVVAALPALAWLLGTPRCFRALAWMLGTPRCSRALALPAVMRLASSSRCPCRPLLWLLLGAAEARCVSARHARHAVAPRKTSRRLPPPLCRPQPCSSHRRAPGEAMIVLLRSLKPSQARRCSASARRSRSRNRCSHLQGHQDSRPPQRLPRFPVGRCSARHRRSGCAGGMPRLVVRLACNTLRRFSKSARAPSCPPLLQHLLGR